jgi:N-terminal domain of anti-restriction factor ArdC
MTRPQTADLYQRVTAQIVASLEQGVRPWLKPWNGAALKPTLEAGSISTIAARASAKSPRFRCLTRAFKIARPHRRPRGSGRFRPEERAKSRF